MDMFMAFHPWTMKTEQTTIEDRLHKMEPDFLLGKNGAEAGQ